MQIVISLVVCGVGALKILLCTTNKAGFKNSQELPDDEHSSSPATSRNNENFAIVCTIMMY